MLNQSDNMFVLSSTVTDPDLPDPEFGLESYYLATFCRKLHENERYWTEGASLATPFGSTYDLSWVGFMSRF